MATYNNQISGWLSGQTVTAEQMNAFSEDIYARFTDLTEIQANLNLPQGLILSLESLSQTGGNVLVGSGSFRFPDTTSWDSYLPYNTGIFGNCDAATVAVTGNGFVVARYIFSPQSNGQTNYTITASYQFVTSLNVTTDCVICVITAGVISSYGRFNYFTSINDNPILGNIDIGNGPIKNGIKNIQITNAPVAGNDPISYVKLDLNGDYTQTGIVTSNGINNNYALISTSYNNGGNSVFKPTILLNVQEDSATYWAGIEWSPGSASTNYQGFYSAFKNYVDITNNFGSYLEMYPNASNDPYSAWYLSNTSTAVTGIELNYNARPAIIGDLDTLGINNQSIVAYNDFPALLSIGSLYQKVPNSSSASQNTTTQVGIGTVTGLGTTISFPIAFPNACVAAVAMIKDSTSPSAIWVTDCVTTTSTLEITLNTSVTSETFTYIAVGY